MLILILSFVITVSATKYYTFPNGPTFEIFYDKDPKWMLKFIVEVPENMYLALAFGQGMVNTDMVLFQAKNEGKVTDLWSTGYTTPQPDKIQSFKDTKIEIHNGKYIFETWRSAQTGDE